MIVEAITRVIDLFRRKPSESPPFHVIEHDESSPSQQEPLRRGKCAGGGRRCGPPPVEITEDDEWLNV